MDIESKMRLLFTQYLEGALVEFEAPHSKTEEERLEVYYQSFKKVIKPLLEGSHSG